MLLVRLVLLSLSVRVVRASLGYRRPKNKELSLRKLRDEEAKLGGQQRTKSPSTLKEEADKSVS